MQRIITYNLSEDFIKNLACYVDENFLKRGQDISKVAFVFAGRRPSLFLSKELSGKIKKGFFSPRFFSIDEFVEYVLLKKAPFKKISDLDACYTVYNLARQTAPEILKGRQSFSEFLPWAREIISFIEQLDLEDIEFKSLENIQQMAQIGYDVPENINALLKSIISLREAYHSACRGENLFSRGLRYLLASKYVREIDFSEFDRILFCGFFYLHKTELGLIKSVYQTKKAVLFFQGSGKDWSVLEKLSQELGSVIEPLKEQKLKQDILIQSGFDAHSEACLAREVLKNIKEPDKAVIVLPEPDNLIPLLAEISGQVEDFNVSIGYPLKRSSLYSLFKCIFRAQETKKDDEYYTKDYLSALSHPLIKNLKVLTEPSATRVLVHKIEEILLGIEKTPLGGSLFIKLPAVENSSNVYELAQDMMKKMGFKASHDEIRDAIEQLHNLLFECWENVDNFYDFSLSLERFLDVLMKKSLLSSYPLNLKMASEIFSVQEELNNVSFNREPFGKEDIFKIFDNKLGNEMVSFSGSPLAGLQVLGLLETRSLSFQDVIIMDVNESVLPRLKIYEPLIPREVMIGLGLNRLEKEEEIQRYQFKRLISSAKNVYLIYQERDDKGKSRFIEEIIWEKQKAAGSLDVAPTAQASFKVKVLPKKLEIKKNADIIKFLKGLEYSASSVNTYMDCPLRFYYHYCLGLEEKEDLLEEPEGRDIGTFIHELLDETFSRFLGRRPRIDDKFREYFFRALDKKFTDEFQRKMKSDSFLIKEILDFRLGRFLDNEDKREVREILCLEKSFRMRIKLSGRTFKFRAIIDRIDRLDDGTLLVLDYKTGSGDIMPLCDAGKIESAGFSREAFKNTIKSFQLPLYLHMVDNDPKYKGGRANAALYMIKDLKEDFGIKKLFKEEALADKDKVTAVYIKVLECLLSDILNPSVAFEADESDSRQCENCPFFYICR